MPGVWLLSFPAGLMTGGSWTTRWQQEYKCQCCRSWEPELLSLWNLHCVGENTNFLQETRPTRILAKLFPDGEKLLRKQVVVSPSEMEWILWFHPGPHCRPVTPSIAKSHHPHRQLSSAAGYHHAQGSPVQRLLVMIHPCGRTS